MVDTDISSNLVPDTQANRDAALKEGRITYQHYMQGVPLPSWDSPNMKGFHPRTDNSLDQSAALATKLNVPSTGTAQDVNAALAPKRQEITRDFGHHDASQVSSSLPAPPAAPLQTPTANTNPSEEPSVLEAIRKNAKPIVAGPSKADAELRRQTLLSKQQSEDTASEGIDAAKQLATGFQQQTDTNNKALDLASEQFNKEQQADRDRMAAIDADRKQREANMDAELAQQQAQHIDPNRMYKNMNTGQKVLGGIGLIMAGLGGAVNKGQNAGVQVIQHAINTDIEAQKTDMENRLNVIGKKIGLNRDSIDAQTSLLKAQQDATYRTYQGAISMLQQKMASNKDNLIAQQSGQTAINDLRTKALEQGDKYAIQLHALDKAKEAQAAAAANAGAVNPETSRKFFYEQKKLYVDKGFSEAQAEAAADRDTRGRFGITEKGAPAASKMSPEENLARIKAGQGAADVQQSLDTVTALGLKASQVAGIGTQIGGAIVPGGTQEQDIVNQYNAQGAALLKSVESRLPQSEAEKIFNRDYSIGPAQSKAQQAERLQAFRNHVKAAIGVKNKNAGAEEPTL